MAFPGQLVDPPVYREEAMNDYLAQKVTKIK